MKKIFSFVVLIAAAAMAGCYNRNAAAEEKGCSEQCEKAAECCEKAGVCSAQVPAPKQKAKQFVEQIFDHLKPLDLDALNKIGYEMGQYIITIDEEQGKEFGEEFAIKFYEFSDKYGYGKEFADQFLETFSQSLTETAEEM